MPAGALAHNTNGAPPGAEWKIQNMLADPQSLTLSQGAKTAARVLTGTTRGRFVAPDGTATLEVETDGTANRQRTIVRVVDQKVAADPLTAVMQKVSASATLTINRPLATFTEAEIVSLVAGLTTWLTAGTNANLKKVIGGEN